MLWAGPGSCNPQGFPEASMTGPEVDYYGVEELLTPEERMIRASVRSTYDMHTLIVGRDITGLDAIR